jgi:hypothetical protein
MPLSVSALVICPRCKTLRSFVNVSAGGVQYKCSGCEWTFTFTAVAPTGTLSAAIVTPASATALTVASGGASFTNGMRLLIDTSVNAEVAQVTGTPTGTSIPVPLGSLAKAHSNGAAFGQLAISITYAGVGQVQQPNPSPYLTGG